MNEEQIDFVEKLLLIEQEAKKLAETLPAGAARGRAEHIATVARLLKARLDIFGPVIVQSRNVVKP
jgi:hypothetical protein